MRQGLIRPTPYWPPPTPQAPSRGSGLRDRIGRHGWVALLILAAGLLAGYNRTGRGLLAMALTWEVVVVVLRSRGDRIRTLAHITVGAALAFALVTAPAAPPKAKAKAEASHADPWAGLRDQAAKLWDRVGDNARPIKFPDQQGGR